MIYRVFFYFLALSMGLSDISFAQSESTIILFRHAEKMSDSRDPDLSAIGKERALTLFKMLNDLQVTELYSTPFNRTTQTIQPFAEALDLEIQTYDHRALDAFADSLKRKEGVILVSGHSNTTPALVSALTGEEIQRIDESEYDNLYIIQLKDGKMMMTVLNYPPFDSN